MYQSYASVFFSQSEFPDGGGIRPLRACGTRFIAHKVCALDRFGAYLNHLLTLIEDPKRNQSTGKN